MAQFKLLFGFELDFCIVLIVLFVDCFNGLENPMPFVGLGLSNCCPACFAKFVGLSSVFVLFRCHSNSGLDFGHYLQWLSLGCEAKHFSIFRIFFCFCLLFLVEINLKFFMRSNYSPKLKMKIVIENFTLHLFAMAVVACLLSC